MRISWNDLTIGFNPGRSEALLEDWRWLVGENVQVVVVSALGDLFLRNAWGHILWLDIGAACLTQIAESVEDFKRFMQQSEYANQWLVPQLVGDLIASGKQLAPGQCYSYNLPPMLGGKMELENFEPTDLFVHCSMFAQIGRQIRNLEEGTRIDRITTTNEDG